jgi:hypothetical protein
MTTILSILYVAGVVILGMHRSGTSLLGGLTVRMGLKVGEPLLPPSMDNEKGYFERLDVFLQNVKLLEDQQLNYSYHPHRYDAMKGFSYFLQDINSTEPIPDVNFTSLADVPVYWPTAGRRSLQFLNDESSFPWMLKDPRLCITLRSWLPYLKYIPAVLFTYRHPMDVALSMSKRQSEQFELSKGLKLWYVYNRMAVEQSHDLCRVVTSHRLIMQQPEAELNRIYDELRGCGVEVPRRVSKEDINDFIDLRLQHGNSSIADDGCRDDILPLPHILQTNSSQQIELYKACMRAYCAMEDKSAFDVAFYWDRSIVDV